MLQTLRQGTEQASASLQDVTRIPLVIINNIVSACSSTCNLTYAAVATAADLVTCHLRMIVAVRTDSLRLHLTLSSVQPCAAQTTFCDVEPQRMSYVPICLASYQARSPKLLLRRMMRTLALFRPIKSLRHLFSLCRP